MPVPIFNQPTESPIIFLSEKLTKKWDQNLIDHPFPSIPNPFKQVCVWVNGVPCEGAMERTSQ